MNVLRPSAPLKTSVPGVARDARATLQLIRRGLGIALLAFVLLPATTLARTSDRNKPMDIDAGHSDYSMDDSRPTVLSGGVIITQGTLEIRADRAVITSANGDPVRVVLTGSPVTLKQELDDGKQMDAVANKVDYDLKTEIVVFTGAVKIRQPSGSIAGERVVYNMKTGQVQGGGQGANDRVRIRIIPKNQGGG